MISQFPTVHKFNCLLYHCSTLATLAIMIYCIFRPAQPLSTTIHLSRLPIMSQPWRNSQVPYFITVKDHNTINHGSTTPTTTSSTDPNGTPAKPFSLAIGTRVSYPQVKFLFQDDTPLTDALEDEDIVLELDATGSQIINSSVGNGEVFQITRDVEITMNGTENNIRSVNINKVSSQIEGMEDLLKKITINRSNDGDDEDDDLEELQNLVHIFNQRNQLLLGCVKSV